MLVRLAKWAGKKALKKGIQAVKRGDHEDIPEPKNNWEGWQIECASLIRSFFKKYDTDSDGRPDFTREEGIDFVMDLLKVGGKYLKRSWA